MFNDTVMTSTSGIQPASSVFRVAVIGSGVSGLAAAHRLTSLAKTHAAAGESSTSQVRVSLIEADSRFGGHAHTVQVSAEGQESFGIDTGFLVYNERTYPGLIALFEQLGVATAKADMSFSVQAKRPTGQEGLVWCGSNINSVFAQRRNLLSPRFWSMLVDIVRFNRLLTAMATQEVPSISQQSVGDYLAANRFGAGFTQDYLLPMIASIWSCPTDQMLQFPIQTLARFCHNHGLLQIINRPQWYTVQGGSANYVQKIVDGLVDMRLNTPVLQVQRTGNAVQIRTAHGLEHFDAVIMATHSDQALKLLGGDASAQERALLGAIGYQHNKAVLHTDATVMPLQRRAWAAWNYERSSATNGLEPRVCLHYWLNVLQPLPTQQPYFVSLNPIRTIDPSKILKAIDYAHPVFDAKAIAAQQQLYRIQGDAPEAKGRTWYAGAWCKYGFHEDGLQAGLQAAQGVWQYFLGQHHASRDNALNSESSDARHQLA